MHLLENIQIIILKKKELFHTLLPMEKLLFLFLQNLYYGGGSAEFNYLLGQTFPFHDRKQLAYPLTDLSFIMTSDGKKVFWSGKGAKTAEEAKDMIKRDTIAFTKIGIATGMIVTQQNHLLRTNIPPIIHNEGRGFGE